MFKRANKLPWNHRIANVLLAYRNIPHSTTGRSPAELFLRRAPRTRLSLVKPSLQKRVEEGQETAKRFRDGNHPVSRSYHLYQRVIVRNTRLGKESWIPGTIIKITGPATYVVRLSGNKFRYVHADHLRQDDSLRDHTGESPFNDHIPDKIEVPTVPSEFDATAGSPSSEGESDNVHLPNDSPQNPNHSSHVSPALPSVDNEPKRPVHTPVVSDCSSSNVSKNLCDNLFPSNVDCNAKCENRNNVNGSSQPDVFKEPESGVRTRSGRLIKPRNILDI